VRQSNEADPEAGSAVHGFSLSLSLSRAREREREEGTDGRRVRGRGRGGGRAPSAGSTSREVGASETIIERCNEVPRCRGARRAGGRGGGGGGGGGGGREVGLEGGGTRADGLVICVLQPITYFCSLVHNGPIIRDRLETERLA